MSVRQTSGWRTETNHSNAGACAAVAKKKRSAGHSWCLVRWWLVQSAEMLALSLPGEKQDIGPVRKFGRWFMSRFTNLNINTMTEEEIFVAEYGIAIACFTGLYNILGFVMAHFTGFFGDIKHRFFAGTMNAVGFIFYFRAKDREPVFRLGCATGSLFVFLRLYYFLKKADPLSLSTFVNLYLHFIIFGVVLCQLFLTQNDVHLFMVASIPATIAFFFLFPDIPSIIFKDLLYSIFSIYLMLVPAGIVIIAQRRTMMRQKMEVEKAKTMAEDLAQIRAQFLAAMSHEVRTPLNGIVGLANVLMNTHMEPGQRELLDVRFSVFLRIPSSVTHGD